EQVFDRTGDHADLPRLRPDRIADPAVEAPGLVPGRDRLDRGGMIPEAEEGAAEEPADPRVLDGRGPSDRDPDPGPLGAGLPKPREAVGADVAPLEEARLEPGAGVIDGDRHVQRPFLGCQAAELNGPAHAQISR